MQGSVIAIVFLAAIVAALVIFIVTYVLKKNQRDLKKLEGELNQSKVDNNE